MIAEGIDSGSFRDPSGFVFYKGEEVYRRINNVHKVHYDKLMEAGLYAKLSGEGLLVTHQEIGIPGFSDSNTYKIIHVEKIPYISYPYEWCFSQLKQAALATIRIVKEALDFGMILSDANAYNIQFRDGKPIFIDTLSFVKYEQGTPWLAYKQFCQHFLAPLALMSYKDVRLVQLLRVHIDGIPLDLASSLLPFKTKIKSGLLMHIHMHAKSQQHYSDKALLKGEHKMSAKSLLGLIDHLESTIKAMDYKPEGTEWADYYNCTNYSSFMFQEKVRLVNQFVDQVKPETVWDLGANTGVFSRIASSRGIATVAFDIDPGAVEKNYLGVVSAGDRDILPLVLDLTNPSPGIGWENNERRSFIERGPADMVFALALIHHLAISNNVPLERVAKFFSSVCRSLVIEFVPKGDSQVQRLLKTREDIFHDYTQSNFEKEFRQYFTIETSVTIGDSQRTLYLMTKGD